MSALRTFITVCSLAVVLAGAGHDSGHDHGATASPSPSPPAVDDHDHAHGHDHGHSASPPPAMGQTCEDAHTGHSHLTAAHTAHGLVMALAALCFFPTGTFIARRVNLDKKAHMGKKSFMAHRACQLLGVALVISGFCIALTMVDGCHFWSSSQNLIVFHGMIGFCIVALLVVQVLLGFARPAKDSTIRQRWASVHKLMGHGLGVGMMVNCILSATKLIGEGVMWPVIVVAVGAALWQLVFLALQVKHSGTTPAEQQHTSMPALAGL